MTRRGGRDPGGQLADVEPLLGVVFDFDGVIADTERLHLQAYQDVLGDRGVTLSKDDYADRYLGFDDAGVFTHVAADRGFALEGGELHRLIEAKGRRFTALVEAGDVLFPDAPACIERLAADLVLGIASGALHREIDDILGAAGLHRHFSAIVAADDVEHAKPAPDGYARAVELLSAELGRPPLALRLRGDSRTRAGASRPPSPPAPALHRRYDDLRRRRAARGDGRRIGSGRHRLRRAGGPAPAHGADRGERLRGRRTPRARAEWRPVTNVVSTDFIRRFAEVAKAPSPDLAPAALAIARMEYPQLDASRYLRALDRMGAAAADRLATLGDDADLPRRIAGISTYLFKEQGFAGNRKHYDDRRNSFLNNVIDRRTGIPITLALVYIEVSRRAGLRTDGVNFPGHFLLRVHPSAPDSAGPTCRRAANS